METADLTILQRMVQESIQKADLTFMAWDNIAKSVPVRLDMIEQRIGGLEKRVTLVEDSQNDASRRLYRIEAGITDLSVRLAALSQHVDNLDRRFDGLDQRFANVETLLAKIADR